MTLNETHIAAFERGEVAYAALNFLETYFKDRQWKISEGFDDGIHEALWDVLGYIEVEPA